MKYLLFLLFTAGLAHGDTSLAKLSADQTSYQVHDKAVLFIELEATKENTSICC